MAAKSPYTTHAFQNSEEADVEQTSDYQQQSTTILQQQDSLEQLAVNDIESDYAHAFTMPKLQHNSQSVSLSKTGKSVAMAGLNINRKLTIQTGSKLTMMKIDTSMQEADTYSKVMEQFADDFRDPAKLDFFKRIPSNLAAIVRQRQYNQEWQALQQLEERHRKGVFRQGFSSYVLLNDGKVV